MKDSDRPVWRFDNAIVRRPAASAINGLRAVDQGDPSVDGLRAEHQAYASALRDAGLKVHVFSPLEAYPDSMFVEDPALVFPDCAIRLRPGAPSRRGEIDAIAPILDEHFPIVVYLPEPGFADGGDILVTEQCVYIGLSARTDRAGAEALATLLMTTGRTSRIVTPPPGILHLKTACSLLDDDTVLATDAIARSGMFSGMNVICVPDGEEAAANALRINDVVLLGGAFAKTRTRLESAGYQVVSMPVQEVGKLDAGLSCMSLRW